MAGHRGHAEPARSRLLRHRSSAGLGYGPQRPAGADRPVGIPGAGSRLGQVLLRAATPRSGIDLLIVDQAGTVEYQCLHLYGSYDPAREADRKLRRWATTVVDRFAGVNVSIVPRQKKRSPPACPTCHPFPPAPITTRQGSSTLGSCSPRKRRKGTKHRGAVADGRAALEEIGAGCLAIGGQAAERLAPKPGAYLNNIDGAWRVIRKRAGLADVRVHDHAAFLRLQRTGTGKKPADDPEVPGT